MDDSQSALKRDAYLREMERKSLDILMVYNPTEKDYLLEWDKRYFKVPAKNKNMGFGPGKMEMERYLAEKYAREMKNLLINTMEAQSVEQLKKDMEVKGNKFRDKFEENMAALPLVPKTSDEDKIKKIYDEIILGVVREYGMEMPDEVRGEEMDTKTPEEKVLENLNRPYVEKTLASPDEEKRLENEKMGTDGSLTPKRPGRPPKVLEGVAQ